MEKAKNIEEVYHNFQPDMVINAGNKEFYVDIFEDKMKRFAKQLELAQTLNNTYLIAGQSGNGKSSALNMLSISDKYTAIKNKYDFKYVSARKSFDYLTNIEAADVLFNIAYTIIKDDDDLQQKFVDALEDLQAKFNKELEEQESKKSVKETAVSANANVSLGLSIIALFKAKIDIASNYSANDEAVKSAKHIFKFKQQDLIKIVNDIINDYHTKHKKRIIVIIDDLEKRNDIDHLFINTEKKAAELSVLNALDIIKIISAPVHIARTAKVHFAEFLEFGINLDDTNRALLKQLIFLRLDNKKIIDEDALEKVIEYSGGNLRQLSKLIYNAALEAIISEVDKISIEFVKIAINNEQLNLSSFVMLQVEFLNEIVNDKKQDISDKVALKQAVHNQVLFAYFNGNTWFDINPVAKKSLDFYLNPKV